MENEKHRPLTTSALMGLLVAAVGFAGGPRMALAEPVVGIPMPRCSSPRAIEEDYLVDSPGVTLWPGFEPGCYSGPLNIRRTSEPSCTPEENEVFNDLTQQTETKRTQVCATDPDSHVLVKLNGANIRGGVSIETSNVTLDCGGGTIFAGGPDSQDTGVNLSRKNYLNNVTIRNCTILGFKNGVWAWAREGLVLGPDKISEKINIDNVIMVGNGAYSHCYELDDVTVVPRRDSAGNPICSSEELGEHRGSGLYFRVRDSVIENSIIYGFGIGVQFVGSYSNEILDNFILGNVYRSGIVLDTSPMNEIRRNRIHGNRRHGVAVYTNCGEYGGVGPNGVIATPWSREFQIPGYGEESSGRNRIIGNLITGHKDEKVDDGLGNYNRNGMVHSAGVALGMRQGAEYNTVDHPPVTNACQGFKGYTHLHTGQGVLPAKGLCGCTKKASHMYPQSRYRFDESNPTFRGWISVFNGDPQIFIPFDPEDTDPFTFFFGQAIAGTLDVSIGVTDGTYSGPHRDFAANNNVSENRFHDNTLGVLIADDGNSVFWNDFDVADAEVQADAPMNFPATAVTPRAPWAHIYVGDNELDDAGDAVGDIVLHHNSWPEDQACIARNCALWTQGTRDLLTAGVRGSGRSTFNGSQGITRARP